MFVYFVLALVVILAVAFTYTIGFQDGSGVAASAIKARAITGRQAVVLVSIFEFTGAMLGGSAVARAIRDITSWPARPDLLPVLASSLSAAIIWNIFTRRMGVPTSSTHALVGGILGGVIAGGGMQYISWGSPDLIYKATGVWKVLLSLFLSPFAGFLVGLLLFKFFAFILKSVSTKANKYLNGMEWILVPMLAFGHGANETQKAMGVIMLALCAAGLSQGEEIPLWVRTISALAVASGILSVAPLIVRRVGGIYKQRPLHGFISQLSSASIVLFASFTGGPLSTSQVVASSIVGVGSAERIKGVHWQVAREIVRAWFLTIPAVALFAWLLYMLLFRHLNLFL